MINKLMLILTLMLTSNLCVAKYKDFVVALPIIAMGGEAQAKFEYNLSGLGGLGLEVLLTQEGEEFTDEEVLEKNGDSLIVRGNELALTYSVYSNAKKMSGGYWTLGVGYRQMQADWSRGPSEEFTPSGVSLDSDGKFKHELVSSGVSARGRVGYRYVADSLPLMLGAYIGLRHYENKFEDRESDDAVETPEKDLESLSRRMMSRLEPGIEIGMAF